MEWREKPIAYNAKRIELWNGILKGYICYVPFVENDEEIFLKTIIPSRKLHKEFKGGSNEKR